jgi:hypothetical protein
MLSNSSETEFSVPNIAPLPASIVAVDADAPNVDTGAGTTVPPSLSFMTSLFPSSDKPKASGVPAAPAGDAVPLGARGNAGAGSSNQPSATMFLKSSYLPLEPHPFNTTNFASPMVFPLNASFLPRADGQKTGAQYFQHDFSEFSTGSLAIDLGPMLQHAGAPNGTVNSVVRVRTTEYQVDLGSSSAPAFLASARFSTTLSDSSLDFLARESVSRNATEQLSGIEDPTTSSSSSTSGGGTVDPLNAGAVLDAVIAGKALLADGTVGPSARKKPRVMVVEGIDASGSVVKTSVLGTLQ